MLDEWMHAYPHYLYVLWFRLCPLNSESQLSWIQTQAQPHSSACSSHILLSLSLSLATPSSGWLLRPKTGSFWPSLSLTRWIYQQILSESTIYFSPLVLLKPWSKSLSSFTWIIVTISLVSLQPLLSSVYSQHRDRPYSGVNQVTLLFKTFQLYPKCLRVKAKVLINSGLSALHPLASVISLISPSTSSLHSIPAILASLLFLENIR